MNITIFPAEVTVNIKVDPATLKVFERVLDILDDRKAAAQLAEDLKATTGALSNVIPSP